MTRLFSIVLLLNVLVWRSLANDVIPGVFSFDPQGLVEIVRMADADDHSFDGIEGRRIYEYISNTDDRLKITLRLRTIATAAENGGSALKEKLGDSVAAMTNAALDVHIISAVTEIHLGGASGVSVSARRSLRRSDIVLDCQKIYWIPIQTDKLVEIVLKAPTEQEIVGLEKYLSSAKIKVLKK